jgi:hypothetical protein
VVAQTEADDGGLPVSGREKELTKKIGLYLGGLDVELKISHFVPA